MNLLEAIVLGILQGVFEWLPVSSEAVVSIFMTGIMGSSVQLSINTAIWLHIGTMLAALLYFREEFEELLRFFIKRLFELNLEREGSNTENLFVFITVSTIFTSIVGGVIYLGFLELLGSKPDLFSGLTAGALLLTGVLRFYSPEVKRGSGETKWVDSTFVGVLQGLAVIPGISRSGSTFFGLLFRGFSGEDAFRLSFLMSVPAVLIANIGINLFSGFEIGYMNFVSAATAFVIGYLTIDIVINFAEKAAVAYLCFVLAAISSIPLII